MPGFFQAGGSRSFWRYFGGDAVCDGAKKAQNQISSDLTAAKSNFQAGCSTIAAAITAMGVATANNATPSVMAANIKKISTMANAKYQTVVVDTGNITADGSVTMTFKFDSLAQVDGISAMLLEQNSSRYHRIIVESFTISGNTVTIGVYNSSGSGSNYGIKITLTAFGL